MIKFFRRIRQQLITENKFSKYLLYAIGEIVLVVIGILIALSINNWNENNKLNKEEKKMLISLNTDFKENLVRLEKTIALQEKMIKNSKGFIQIMLSENKNVGSDSIANMISRGAQSWWRAEYVTGTYNAILGSGNINVLKNDDLKRILAEFSSEVNSGFEDHEESMNILFEFNKSNASILPYLMLDNQYERLGLVKNEKAISASANEIITNKANLGLLINKTILEGLRTDYQYKIKDYIREILTIIASELEK